MSCLLNFLIYFLLLAVGVLPNKKIYFIQFALCFGEVFQCFPNVFGVRVERR